MCNPVDGASLGYSAEGLLIEVDLPASWFSLPDKLVASFDAPDLFVSAVFVNVLDQDIKPVALVAHQTDTDFVWDVLRRDLEA